MVSARPSSPKQSPTTLIPAAIEAYPNMLYQYDTSWMFSAMDSDGEEVQHTDPRHELQTYLSSPRESWRALPEIAVFKWWKDHGAVYPTLLRMAQDFLTIPGSSTASERQFSSA